MRLQHLLWTVLLATTTFALAQAQTTKMKTTQPNKKPTRTAPKSTAQQLPFADARSITVIVLRVPPENMPVPNAIGSGVWIGKNGYVVSCQHVIGNLTGTFKIGLVLNPYITEQIVIGSPVRDVDADVVASDPNMDVAILKAHERPDQLLQQSPVRFLGSGKPPVPLIPDAPLIPKGAALKTDLPQLGETLLLSGFPLDSDPLVLQTGVATGFLYHPMRQTSPAVTGLRIMLSVVSNPGNSGGPVLDADGNVVGLLEGSLTSPVRDEKGAQVLSPRVKIDDAGHPVLNPQGQPQFEIAPLQQNAGISFAVPARYIADLAEKNGIDLR